MVVCLQKDSSRGVGEPSANEEVNSELHRYISVRHRLSPIRTGSASTGKESFFNCGVGLNMTRR